MISTKVKIHMNKASSAVREVQYYKKKKEPLFTVPLLRVRRTATLGPEGEVDARLPSSPPPPKLAFTIDDHLGAGGAGTTSRPLPLNFVLSLQYLAPLRIPIPHPPSRTPTTTRQS